MGPDDPRTRRRRPLLLLWGIVFVVLGYSPVILARLAGDERPYTGTGRPGAAVAFWLGVLLIVAGILELLSLLGRRDPP